MHLDGDNQYPGGLVSNTLSKMQQQQYTSQIIALSIISDLPHVWEKHDHEVVISYRVKYYHEGYNKIFSYEIPQLVVRWYEIWYAIMTA